LWEMILFVQDPRGSFILFFCEGSSMIIRTARRQRILEDPSSRIHSFVISHGRNIEKVKQEAFWEEESQRWRLPDMVITRTKLPKAGEHMAVDLMSH
jgi:hypothetical protein